MNKLFTKQELRRINLRHMFGLQLGHNYERMQGLGYFYAILPALKKIYKDESRKHSIEPACPYPFYNTTAADV